MRIPRSVPFLAAAILAATATAGDLRTPPGEAGQPFVLHGSGHIIVPAAVNGVPVRMIVDTGAGATIVDAAAAEALGLRGPAAEARATGAGGDGLAMRIATGNTLAIGDLRERDIALGIMDLGHVTSALARSGAGEVSGVIGADLLVRHGAIIDYRRRLIVFAPADAAAQAPPADGGKMRDSHPDRPP